MTVRNSPPTTSPSASSGSPTRPSEARSAGSSTRSPDHRAVLRPARRPGDPAAIARCRARGDLRTRRHAEFLQRTQRGPVESPILAISRSSCACQDADGALYQLLHSGNGWTIVENNEVGSLLDSARATLDPAMRLADYRKVHEIVAATLPVVPLYQTVVGYGAVTPLQFTPTPNESLFLNRMRWVD